MKICVVHGEEKGKGRNGEIFLVVLNEREWGATWVSVAQGTWRPVAGGTVARAGRARLITPVIESREPPAAEPFESTHAPPPTSADPRDFQLPCRSLVPQDSPRFHTQLLNSYST